MGRYDALLENPLVFGGTFSPPHRGHLHALRQCRLLFPSARIIVVPSYHTPFKGISDMLPFGIRLRLCRLALEDYAEIYPDDGAPPIRVSDVESKFRRQMRTWETVSVLASSFGLPREGEGWRIGFVVGDDVLERLGEWDNPGFLKRHITFIVLRRPGFGDESRFARIADALASQGYSILRTEREGMEASSEMFNKRGRTDLITSRVLREMREMGLA